MSLLNYWSDITNLSFKIVIKQKMKIQNIKLQKKKVKS